jgi:hypothetical protein
MNSTPATLSSMPNVLGKPTHCPTHRRRALLVHGQTLLLRLQVGDGMFLSNFGSAWLGGRVDDSAAL